MAHREVVIRNLNDLVEINNIRISTYIKAIESLNPDDSHLKTVFAKMIAKSCENNNVIIENIKSLGGEVETHPKNVLGKIYRTWDNFKSTLLSKEHYDLIEYLEFFEHAVINAYRIAIDTKSEFTKYVDYMLNFQKDSLSKDYEQIRLLKESGIKIAQ